MTKDHEKIFKLEDGSRVKIRAFLYVDNVRAAEYNFTVWVAKKGKRTWIDTINRDDYSWRGLSLEEREIHNLKKQIEVATAERLDEVALELWEKLKPKPLLS